MGWRCWPLDGWCASEVREMSERTIVMLCVTAVVCVSLLMLGIAEFAKPDNTPVKCHCPKCEASK